MQFYESSIPSENTDVAIRITDIHEYGVEAILLEYADAPKGIIYNKDLSRKRVRTVRDVVRIGQETVATVMHSTYDSITLSLRNMNKEGIDAVYNEYCRHKAVHGILKSIAISHSDETMLKMFYETLLWPIARLDLDIYDEFLSLHDSTRKLCIDTPYLEEIRKLVQARLPAPLVTKHRDVDITYSNSLSAPSCITDCLHTVMSTYGCEVNVIAPPIYRIQVTAGTEKEASSKLDTIQAAIAEYLTTQTQYNTPAVSVAPTLDNEITLDLADIAHNQATMNLGTLGNVSEGKSTFVRAISKIATQRHKKEKLFNITINLGYAGFKIWRNVETGDLVSSSSSTKVVDQHELLGHYSFVDCPGHEAYLATMLSGATIMDAAALIIASNSPSIPQIQTQEHLIAAETMGLENIFVIQNKLDVVDTPIIGESLSKIREFTKGTSAEKGPIIPMSAQREWGIEYALHHIAYTIPTPNRQFEGPVRIQLVRSFDINRPIQWSSDSAIQGGVIGGTIVRGVVYPEDILEIRPGLFINGQAIPILTRVSSLNCDAESLKFAIAGGLIGIGTSMDPSFTSANALAGHVAGTPGTLPEITVKIKGKFRAFDRSQSAEKGSDLAYKFKKHKKGDAIRFCVGNMTVSGHISKVGENGMRTIKVERPVCVEPGQICSILRSNGSRELLDGILIAESVTPYRNVASFSEYEQHIMKTSLDCVLSRKYRVLDNTRTHNALPLPSYECMLDAIETHFADTNKHSSMKLPPPAVQRLPKKTAWLNITEVLDSIKSHTPDHANSVGLDGHFQEYLTNELCTTLTVKKEGQYVLAGRFTDANFCTILRKYIQKYHKCAQCGSCYTCLIRIDRVITLLCGGCTSNSSIIE